MQQLFLVALLFFLVVPNLGLNAGPEVSEDEMQGFREDQIVLRSKQVNDNFHQLLLFWSFGTREALKQIRTVVVIAIPLMRRVLARSRPNHCRSGAGGTWLQKILPQQKRPRGLERLVMISHQTRLGRQNKLWVDGTASRREKRAIETEGSGEESTWTCA